MKSPVGAYSGDGGLSSYAAYREQLKRRRLEVSAGLSHKSPGWVYLASSMGSDFKIGHSKRVDRRRKELAAKEGATVSILAAGFFLDRLSVEQKLHSDYAARRIRGEWFALDPADVAAVVAFLDGAVV